MSDAIAVRGDWETMDMPAENTTFILNRSFTPEEMNVLRRGNIPQEMEDKWFWYMEGDTLYAHRSWTGFCIYIIEFSPDGNHRVTVNRDRAQYSCVSCRDDLDQLNLLLDWWTKPTYDYYGEMVDEIISGIKRKKE